MYLFKTRAQRYKELLIKNIKDPSCSIQSFLEEICLPTIKLSKAKSEKVIVDIISKDELWNLLNTKTKVIIDTLAQVRIDRDIIMSSKYFPDLLKVSVLQSVISFNSNMEPLLNALKTLAELKEAVDGGHDL